MGKIYNNQIKAGSGFTISGEYPIDDRTVVAGYDDLADLVNSNVSYEGMEVYVVANKRAYRLINGTWVGIATATDLPINLGDLNNDILEEATAAEIKQQFIEVFGEQIFAQNSGGIIEVC